jgi:hypothetical protein
MQDSLTNRFQGTFLAAAIGDMWGSQGGSVRSVPRKTDTAAELVGGQETMTLVRQLATSPTWQPPNPLPISPMAAIPLGLWFHDDESLLHAAIRTSVGLGVDALIVGYAIAKILQEKLEPATFFEQVRQWLSTWEPEKSLPASLEIVEQGLQNQEPVAKVTQTLDKSNRPQGEVAVLGALFCFLSTPDFADISIKRAIRYSQQAALVGSITGAFSGAYNGIAKLPVGWEIAGQELPLAERWRVDSMKQLRGWSLRLLAAWCGAFADGSAIAPTTTEWTFPTVAAAGQLRA